MKHLIIASALVSLLASATPAFGQLTVTVQPAGIDGRGGHWAEPGRNFQWILGYYAWGTAKQPTSEGGRAIGIFSLNEHGEPLVPASTYEAALKPAGATHGRRGVTVATALLIEGYATGRLSQWNSSFSYDEPSLVRLQTAIHALEQANSSEVPEDMQRLALAHFGTWQLALQPYEGTVIRVLALTPQGLGAPAKDHLVYLPDAPVELPPGLPAGSAGNSGGGASTPGAFVPPVTPTPGPITNDEFQELTEDLVITLPPTTSDDFSSSTPPGPPIIPNFEPPFTPGNTPDTKGGFVPDQPQSVPDGGMTLAMILSVITLMAWSKRRS